MQGVAGAPPWHAGHAQQGQAHNENKRASKRQWSSPLPRKTLEAEADNCIAARQAKLWLQATVPAPTHHSTHHAHTTPNRLQADATPGVCTSERQGQGHRKPSIQPSEHSSKYCWQYCASLNRPLQLQPNGLLLMPLATATKPLTPPVRCAWPVARALGADS